MFVEYTSKRLTPGVDEGESSLEEPDFRLSLTEVERGGAGGGGLSGVPTLTLG